MPPHDPLTHLATHKVTNQPAPLENYNAFTRDRALVEALNREGAAWAQETVQALGRAVGSAEVIEWGRLANCYPPELHAFDRYGQRIDEVSYHPSYHQLMALAVEHGLPSIAWSAKRPGGHVAHAALTYLFAQAETGVCCPMAMTYAAVPSLRQQPELAAEWEPRVLSREYDARFIPAAEKHGATFGMAMTEKQGGSDVRANTTRATPLGAGGAGAEYHLRGHKWFCSAPMSDAFLTLANTSKGLSCFLVPRWLPDGTRNRFFIQRLKDKLGNRSNASSEIEYDDTWAQLVGEEGRGVPTIIEMVNHTRLDAALAPVGLMRQALLQALHHTTYRAAFGKPLIQQPLMRNVLADLALEVEAATHFFMRIARAFDAAEHDTHARQFARLGVAVAKYWTNKRAPNHIYEALECLGGAGYVEESILPRLYREAPLNSIWEGSGNVICLDVLRALDREPESIEIFLADIEQARGEDKRLDALLENLKTLHTDRTQQETHARRLTETLARALQAALMIQHAPAPLADAYCMTRLAGDWGLTYGTLPGKTDFQFILARAMGEA